MSTASLSKEEVAQRGEAIYAERLIALLETPGNIGNIVVIDVDSGDYDVDASGLNASHRLRVRRLSGNLYAIRIGYDVVEGFGGFAPERVIRYAVRSESL
jgi:hypothetical protein